ncbi:tumor necrosis factor receptor superfamily member 14-like isoform X1 [Myxocyprinus asiaticus]|uniref:tumor necrosis factor receptor superfamily member 14-like isoform X1 n=1 Tax=Myxocyprinus asiaticus TaxID=70543 RepID=UPI0022216EAC|nr:tumor necrosis factor receptor superfamily member 14-like isoform X1 [Myxocyprinus asiaticus]
MNMFNLRIILFISAIVTLDIELCFSACARAEYEINGNCCPMCAPGTVKPFFYRFCRNIIYNYNKPFFKTFISFKKVYSVMFYLGNFVYWHCTENTSTTCVPCPESTYIDEPNDLMKCFPCFVCDENVGLRVQKTCTHSADTVCEPHEGFYCINSSCTFALKHSKCNPGQYIKQTGTAFTDTVCADCTDKTYSDGSLTFCQPHSACETEGPEEIKPGTMSSDAECGKSSPVGLIVVVILAVLVVLIVAAALKKIMCWICLNK